MSKVAKWIFPIAGGKEGIIGTATAVVGFMTGNWGMVASGIAQVAGAGKKSQAQARQASILQLSLGETPREAVLGMTATGGSLVDVFNFGGQYGTDKVTRCVALADHAIDGIEGFYVNDIYYPWTNEGQQAVFSNKLSFHFRNATADGYDPPQHVQQNGGWTPTDRMAGITHIWIDWYVDEKVWPQGHPEFRFVLRGLRAFDPRFDPALGYTGPNPQTWADRSSHKFTRNAKVLRYAYTRGIYAEGHHGDPDYLLIGRGLTAEEAPPELVIADANLCDEIVDGVPRYAVDAVISASQPYIEVDGLFAAAMAGEVIQRQGTVEVEAGQAKAVVVTITDDDLVIGEPVKFSDFLPDNDGGRINTVIGRYIEPSLGYRDHSAPVRRSLAHIQADGGPREQTIALPLVTQVKQVDRIIEIRRLLSRLERRASIVLPPKFAGLEEGDWIAWQSKRRHGGATVRYRIESYRQPETWRMYLTLREIASSVFGVPDPVEDFTAPPPPPVVIDALQLTGVTAEAITLPGDTSTIPAIRFGWTAAVDAALVAIRAEVRRAGETDVSPTRIDDISKGQANATNGVGPDQALECRLVPIGDPSRPVVPSNWITVSTSTIIAGDLSPESPVWTEIELQGVAITEVTDRLVGVEAVAQTVQQGIDDLEEVFGDTVSAAESALAAGDAANLAALKAQEADGSASASNVSAGIASTKADEAGSSASAANAAKVAAESARDGAGGSATAAATSASNASTSATNAGQSASAASGSATAANTSAGNAQTFASQASDSAVGSNTAAISAGVSASTAKAAALNPAATSPGVAVDAFAVEQWEVFNATANLRQSVEANPSQFSFVGGALRVTNRSTIHIHAARPTSRPAGHKVRISATFKRAVDGGDVNNNRVTLYAFGFNAAGVSIQGIEITSFLNPQVSNGVQTLTYDLDDSNLTSAVVWVRAMVRVWTDVGSTDVLTVEARDVQSEAAAASSAAAATTSAASAAGSAASASISSNLAVTANESGGLANSRFLQWPNGQVRPTYWDDWAACSGEPFIQRRDDGLSAQGSNNRRIMRHRYDPNVSADHGCSILQQGITGGGAYNLEVDVAINYGGPTGSGFDCAGVLIQWFTALGAPSDLPGAVIMSFRTQPGIDGTVAGRGEGDGRIYRFKMPCVAPAGARLCRVYAMTRWAGQFGGAQFANELKILDWYRVDLTPASDAERSVPALSAQMSVTTAVAVDAQSRLASTAFEVIGASGGDPAQLLVKTTGTNSLVQLVASALRFGNVIGGQIVDVMKLIGGSVFITGKLLLGAAGQIELDPAYPLILWKFGSARLAIGQLPSNNLFLWFGGNETVPNMRKNNAKVWFDTTGNSYWGGSILAGTISNSVQGSNSLVGVSATLGPFATNGGPITIAWSYDLTHVGSRFGNQEGTLSGTTAATVRLYRRIGAAAETLIDTMVVSGSMSAQYDGEPIPGQPAGTVGQTFFQEYMTQSRTYSDNAGGTSARTYRIAVESRSLTNISGQSNGQDGFTQRYGIVSSE